MLSFQAIQQLSRSGFLHYAAIANEQAGKYMLLQNDEYWARHYLTSASRTYSEWGASAKVEHMNGSYDSVELKAPEEGSLYHGKKQYKATRDSVSEQRQISFSARPSEGTTTS